MTIDGSIISGNLVTANEKFQVWNDKKSLHLRETVLKVAVVACLAILGAAATLAAIYLIPIVPVASSLILSLGLAGLSGYFAVTASSLFLMMFTDWTNYRDSNEVKHLFIQIKNSTIPHSISKYKRWHRFGIISDSELQQRHELEQSCKKYRVIELDLLYARRELVDKQREQKRLEPMNSMDDRKSDLEKEIGKLERKISDLEKSKENIEKKFRDFHTSIVDFVPAKSAVSS